MLLNLMISFSSNLLVAHGLCRISLRDDWLDEASGRVLGTGLDFDGGIVVGRIDAQRGLAVERDVGKLHNEFGKLVPDKVPEGPHGDFGVVAGNIEYADDGIREVLVVRCFEYAGAQQLDWFHTWKFINCGHGRQVYHTRRHGPPYHFQDGWPVSGN